MTPSMRVPRDEAIAPAARRRARRGMTMVELMVALAIISVGVFGLTAGATLVTRLDGSAAIQSRAAVIGATRLERLRSMSCSSVAAGGDTTRGVMSTWTTRAITNGTSQRGVTVNLTVQFPTATGLHTQTYRTILPC